MENDESHSRDSISQRPEETSLSETKLPSKPSVDQPTPEEEEGEIKDDDEHEDSKTSQPEIEPLAPAPPPPPLAPSSAKKSTNKMTNKQPKKPGAPKKRKIEQVKTEPTQEHDDLDNSTLAKRKKR